MPHLYNSKGKTFFFGDYEGTRRPEAGSIAISVPSTAFRNGDLSAYPTQLYNPRTGLPFLNNQIPVNASSASLLNSLYPIATSAGNVNNYNAAFPGDYTLNNGDVRIDENINERQKVWGRFGGKNVVLSGTDGSTSYVPTNGLFSNRNRLRNAVGDYSWTITPPDRK